MNSFDVVCLSTTDWEKPWGSRQQLMTRLAKSSRILFVEPPLSPLHLHKFKKNIDRLSSSFLGIRQVGENIWVCRPVPLFFGGISIRLNHGYHKLFAKQLSKWLTYLCMTPEILWSFSPFSAPLLKYLQFEKVIYHCVDRYAEATWLLNRSDIVYAHEIQLVQQADLVVALSKITQKRLCQIKNSAIYVPSGVDAETFRQMRFVPPPKEMEKIPNPRIVISANFDRRTDVELLKCLVLRQTKWSFVFVGSTVGLVDNRFRNLPNVYSLGQKQYLELPPILWSCDVGIIPYHMNKLTLEMSPVKFYDYLACGLPVVSRPFPEIFQYSQFLYTADTTEEFILGIKLALHDNDNLMIEKRLAFVKEHSWAHRLDKILRSLSSPN